MVAKSGAPPKPAFKVAVGSPRALCALEPKQVTLPEALITHECVLHVPMDCSTSVAAPSMGIGFIDETWRAPNMPFARLDAGQDQSPSSIFFIYKCIYIHTHTYIYECVLLSLIGLPIREADAARVGSKANGPAGLEHDARLGLRCQDAHNLALIIAKAHKARRGDWERAHGGNKTDALAILRAQLCS